MEKRPSLKHIVDRFREIERTRPDLPGERWMLAGAGLALIAAGHRTDARWAAALQAAVGGALLLRAANGRPGAATMLLRAKAAEDALREDARRLGLE